MLLKNFDGRQSWALSFFMVIVLSGLCTDSTIFPFEIDHVSIVWI